MINLLPPSPSGLYHLRWRLPDSDALTDEATFCVGGVFPSPVPGDNALLTFSVIPGVTGEPAALTVEQVRRVLLHRHSYEIVPCLSGSLSDGTPVQVPLF